MARAEAIPAPLDRPMRLARDAAVSLMASGVTQLLNVLSGVLIARSLGPTGRGELAAVMLWPALLAALGAMGGSDAVAYLTSRRPEQARQIGATGLWLAAAQSMAVVSAGCALVPLVLSRYGSGAIVASRLYLLWVPLTMLTLAGMAVMRGRMSLVAFNAVRIIVIVTTVSGLLAVFALGRLTVIAIIDVYVAANILTLAATLAMLASRHELGLAIRRELVRPMLAYGLRVHVGTVSTLVSAQAAQAFVALLLAPVALGLYTVAVTVTSAVGLVGSSLAMVALPAVGRCQSAQEMREAFARFVRVTLALSVLTAAATAMFLPMLLVHVFGAGFAPAAGPAWILLVGGTFASTNLVLGAGMNAFGRPLVPSTAQLIAAVVTGLALVVLMPLCGLIGAALATLLAGAAATVHLVAHATRRMDVRAAELLPGPRDVAWAWRHLMPRVDAELAQ
jgi:O-antigen/teichoic acid export membrane protein